MSELYCRKCKQEYLISRHSYDLEGEPFWYCLLSHQRGHIFVGVHSAGSEEGEHAVLSNHVPCLVSSP